MSGYWKRMTLQFEGDEGEPSSRLYHSDTGTVAEAIKTLIAQLRADRTPFQRDGDTLTFQNRYGTVTLHYSSIDPKAA